MFKVYWAYKHSVPLDLTHINEKSKQSSQTYKTYIMHIYRMNSKIAKCLTYIVQYIVKYIVIFQILSLVFDFVFIN